jgi:hypothetical protein
LIIGYRTRLAACQRLLARACVPLLTVMNVALPWVASAQRADGSIAVSLTILPPGADQSARITAFRIDRDGIATLRTSAPAAAHASRIVMTRVASEANGFVPARYVPALPCAMMPATECAERELRFRVDVGSSADSVRPRDVRLRIEYLVVAGT